ncbi:MAG: response regulator [Candidatus Omnitrophica bacterium]|nr:response regulator [Candidatus Omnitrophota bacterium]MBU1128824.1 response regulator [Candidatus Omnitrophota bacterium]MBU1783783.1 response regulator [Candidatus Omnitrophota bacterium]MBU1852124.1 response regulator [Candidatus Omnitrophota bacterium]
MIKIMIVDDETEICDFVQSFFKERNFDVVTANNGREALVLAEMQNPDIILLDLKMPVMDGMETLKELKKRCYQGKVVMVTAVEDMGKIDEARSYGVAEYITKPLVLGQLAKIVLKLAGEHSLSS